MRRNRQILKSFLDFRRAHVLPYRMTGRVLRIPVVYMCFYLICETFPFPLQLQEPFSEGTEAIKIFSNPKSHRNASFRFIHWAVSSIFLNSSTQTHTHIDFANYDTMVEKYIQARAFLKCSGKKEKGFEMQFFVFTIQITKGNISQMENTNQAKNFTRIDETNEA